MPSANTPKMNRKWKRKKQIVTNTDSIKKSWKRSHMAYTVYPLNICWNTPPISDMDKIIDIRFNWNTRENCCWRDSNRRRLQFEKWHFTYSTTNISMVEFRLSTVKLQHTNMEPIYLIHCKCFLEGETKLDYRSWAVWVGLRSYLFGAFGLLFRCVLFNSSHITTAKLHNFLLIVKNECSL